MIMILLTFLLATTSVKGQLDIYPITEQSGFADIKLNQADIVSKTSLIAHIINT